MEYYSAIKKNELLISATTWRDLRIITLHEKRQTKKKKKDYILYGSIYKILENTN